MRDFLRVRGIVATAAVLASALCGFSQTTQQTEARGPIALTGGAASCGSAAFLLRTGQAGSRGLDRPLN
jgi:hypothetical protein